MNRPQTATPTNPKAPDGSIPLSDIGGIVGEAVVRFNNLYMPLQLERAMSLEDRRFAFITGAQWEGDWGELFTNSIKVEINKAAQGLEDIIDQYKKNRIIVNFRSVEQAQKGDAASTLNGMFLADYYNSNGVQSTDNAFLEGASGGQGAFRLTNVYCNDEDAEDDSQRIIFEPITDADQSVFWDPNSKRYDKSDAGYCYVITALSKETFAADYGEDKIASWPVKFLKPYYDWFTPDVVRVAEYYKVVEIKDTVYTFQNKLTGDTDKVYESDENYQEGIRDKLITGWEQVKKRKITRKECRKWILSGAEILNEEGEEGMLIAGGMIPVIPFYGRRAYIDNIERSKGHIRLAKDPQRVYNVQISKLTEQAALAPSERPIFVQEQIENHEDEWNNANINRAPYAVINSVIDEASGSLQPLGPVGKVEPPQLPPVLSALIQITNNDIKELTNSDDGAAQVKANVSADAMNIAAERTDDKADKYIDNMKDTMKRAGEIYQAMAREIYFEDNRQVDYMTFDKKQQPVFSKITVNERSTDESGGQVIKNNLTQGKYNVIVDVAEGTKTKRDKVVKSLYNTLQIIMPADAQLGSVVASTMFLNMDGEGIEDLQSYVRNKMLMEGIVQPTEEEKQMLAQMKEQQAQQPPSPEDQLATSAAQNQAALAQKALAEAGEAKTKALVNVANAAKLRSEAGANHVETIKSIHTPIETSEKPSVTTDNSTSKTKEDKGNFLSRFLRIRRR